ncbi:hypothetical protein [Aeromonas jandaei]|uniref:hypothetical protein n=1 Tax=Aeromonas jandaei TaxID=650 RepID=UPI003B9EBDB9
MPRDISPRFGARLIQSRYRLDFLSDLARLIKKMPTSLEAISNEHLQEQASKARFAARICMPTFWHNAVNARHNLSRW